LAILNVPHFWNVFHITSFYFYDGISNGITGFAVLNGPETEPVACDQPVNEISKSIDTIRFFILVTLKNNYDKLHYFQNELDFDGNGKKQNENEKQNLI